MSYYPLFLDLRDEPCVVLGGGTLAAGKVRELLLAEARVTLVAAELEPEAEAAAADPRVRVERRAYQPGDLGGARLVVDASGDPLVNRASWAEAEAARILINVVDVTDKCRFIAPAVVRREPLLVAISTAGESPFIASTLRARLERVLGPEWGPFTALVGEVRRGLRAAGVPLDRQLKAYRRLLASEALGLLRRGDAAEARREAEVIAAEAGQDRPGRVALVGAGPGDPRLLTVAAQEQLWLADVVMHDALVAPETIAQAGPGARLVDVGKRAGRANPDQASITAEMIQLARAGLNIVRLKGGDPFVFGRGGEELADLIAAGIEVVVVPGVSSAIAGPAAAGIPLTLREVASSVGIVSGHSAHPGAGVESLQKLAAAVDTLVVLMPLGRLGELTVSLADVLPGDRPAAVIASATTAAQRTVRAPLDRIARAAAEEGVAAPALLVIGEVVDALPRRRLAELLSAVGQPAIGLPSSEVRPDAEIDRLG
ncbi:MAG: siroheme synthase CysG [Candidatus Dormibacteraeota bacterium]|nr:siroheme synthase CysG [Candidatus Dormibacteraeota bacterium]